MPDIGENRARDVVDLVLLKRLSEELGSPTGTEIRLATEDIFDSRAAEALETGHQPRFLPTKVRSYSHWEVDYASAARSAGLDLKLDDAVEEVNNWLSSIGVGA